MIFASIYYSHQLEFPSTTKFNLRKQCKAFREYVKKPSIAYPNNLCPNSHRFDFDLI